MSNSIAPKLTLDELIALFRKEAKIGKDRSVTFSRRGVSRLSGKEIATISSLLAKIKGELRLDVIGSQKGLDINEDTSFSSAPILSKKTKYDKSLSKPLKL